MKSRWFLFVGALFLITSLGIGGTYFLLKYISHMEVMTFVCGLVEKKFYENNERLKSWVRECFNETKSIRYFEDTQSVLSRLQLKMNQLGVSHAAIYTPSEDKLIWEGQGHENGARVRQVESKYVVTQVLPGAPAQKAGVEVGDIVEEYEGQAIYAESQLNEQKGQFTLRRKGKEIYSIFLEPVEIKLDTKAQLVSLGSEVGWLQIPSFRGDLFAKDSWMKIVKDFNQYKKLVIDIRENSGGSFIAMLRALSPFFCKPTKIGHLLSPRQPASPTISLEDIIEEEYLLQLLKTKKEINLVTYSDYGCYRKPVVILTNTQTASVSEIFAYAFVNRPYSHIWGEPTAGNVLLAVWYFLPFLPNGYTMSIPEAMVLTHDSLSLEASGVWPDRILSYRLKDAIEGKDSWIMETLK